MTTLTRVAIVSGSLVLFGAPACQHGGSDAPATSPGAEGMSSGDVAPTNPSPDADTSRTLGPIAQAGSGAMGGTSPGAGGTFGGSGGTGTGGTGMGGTATGGGSGAIAR